VAWTVVAGSTPQLVRLLAALARGQLKFLPNAIDFYVQVLGLSFHDAMRQITGP
jgi:hypothetical protein